MSQNPFTLSSFKMLSAVSTSSLSFIQYVTTLRKTLGENNFSWNVRSHYY